MLAMIFCAFFSWTMVILSILSVWLTLKKGANHLKRLHEIPCHNCEFFTNDYRLKCTVQLKRVLSKPLAVGSLSRKLVIVMLLKKDGASLAKYKSVKSEYLFINLQI